MADDDLDLKAPEIIPVTDLEIPPEGTRTPEEGDSLLGMLARRRHPEHFEEGTPVTPEGEEKSPEPPEVKAEDLPEAQKEKEAAPEPPEFKPKYKSHEEAERAYDEAERKMHEATTQAARDREGQERLTREAEELRRQLAEKEAAKPPAKTPEELEAEEEARIAQALDEIDQIETNDRQEYLKLAAKAWRKAGFGGMGQPTAPDAKTLDEMIDHRLAERQRQDEENLAIRTQAIEMAGQAGLNMEVGSEDFKLFWDQAKALPPEVRAKPLQEQVDWAAEEAKKLRKPDPSPTVEALTEEQKELMELGREYKAKQVQSQNTVLGKGASDLKPSQEAQPETFSMGGILRQQQKARQLCSST